MPQLWATALLLLLIVALQTAQGFSTRPSLTQTTKQPPASFQTRIIRYGVYRYRNNPRLTTTASSNNEGSSSPNSAIRKAVDKFRARPATYLIIPCVAAVVGWFTNWLAVQMIFYPINFRGIPIYRRPEVPLGLLGWQGIIPCKTRQMTITMTDMVTNELLTVQEAFQRLDPKQIARLLAPEVPKLTQEIVQDIAPSALTGLPAALYAGFDSITQGILQHFNTKFLEKLTVALQQNADKVFNLRNCVVNQMMLDRAKLGALFRKCGQAELNFLTNSGLWFGFLLGIIQMIVALFWDNPWSLSIGGGIVGLATNWLALKWIFEPVDPLRIGNFVLQGKFLRRQKEVAAEFSNYFANNILTGKQIWHSMLTDPETKPAFAKVFSEQFQSFVGRITRGFRVQLEPETINAVTERAIDKLPAHVPVLFPYMDKALGLERTLRVKMEQMTSRKFERVLHPIFEEDELTLILAGAALGFAAGLVQQGLETGSIKIPDFWTPLRNQTVAAGKYLRAHGARVLRRIRRTTSSEESSSTDNNGSNDNDAEL